MGAVLVLNLQHNSVISKIFGLSFTGIYRKERYFENKHLNIIKYILVIYLFAEFLLLYWIILTAHHHILSKEKWVSLNLPMAPNNYWKHTAG
jgi:hypothetical protein